MISLLLMDFKSAIITLRSHKKSHKPKRYKPMSEIKHIVYLMLENRSLDNLLGWLYDDIEPKVNIPFQDPPTYNGLKTSYFNLDKHGNKHFVHKGVNQNMHVPAHDPHEEFSHINNQVFGHTNNPTEKPDPSSMMGGFYKDFAEYNDDMDQIMMSYTPEELPVINGLARHFAVSDHYFCSVPSQTNCNRAFAASGNSLGETENNTLKAWVNNRKFSHELGTLSQPIGKQYNQKTMWNVLYDNGMDQPSDWMIYYSQGTFIEDSLGAEGYAYVRDLMHELQDEKFDAHFDTMETFFEKAKSGNLPSVSFLEPKWGLEEEIVGIDHVGINGTDYHPPGDVTDSEKFLKEIYDALTSNEDTWANILWIINFDEHGGTYDHVPPPWGATPPWSSDGTPKPEEFELDFQFDRFGVRVPFILVSPYIKESTVFRAEGKTPYDHTSVIATILNMMGIPKDKWGLGGRTANAPTFENIFMGNDLREEIPPISINTKGIRKPKITQTTPPNHIQLSIAESLISKAIRKKGLTRARVEALSLPSVKSASSMADLHNKLKLALHKIYEKI